MKLIKGSMYIVMVAESRIKSTGWIVQQVSMKQWCAVRFTHMQDGYKEEVMMTGNSLELLPRLEMKCYDGAKLDYMSYYSSQTLREAMFNVLKKGELL